jgi:hypothetical protein
MKKLYLLFCLYVFATYQSQGQVAVADVQSIYGGRINTITGGNIDNNDSFRVFVSTESANSIFYADAKRPPLGSPTVNRFTLLPCAGASANLGSGIRQMAYHQASGKVFFVTNNNLYSASITATTPTLVATGNVTEVAIKDNQLFYLTKTGSTNDVKGGTLNNTGAYTNTSSATYSGKDYSALVVGRNDKLYAFSEGTDPQVYEFTGTFSTSITLTTGTTDALASLSPAIYWKAFNAYADTALFAGGTDNNNKQIAKSPAFGSAYTTINTGIAGTYGNNIEFHEGLVNNYLVYFGSAYSSSKGLTGTWNNFGNTGFETHPNDGCVYRLSSNIPGATILITTDMGIGQSNNNGGTIFEINDGVEAVQVADFDMNSSKNFGWLASKAGIRYVSNYKTSSQAWSKAMFANGDGSPYFSIDMIGDLARGAYAGNVRVYRTYDTGKVWQQVFSPDVAPYNFPQGGTQVRSIRSCSFDTTIVFVTVTIQGSDLGGVFYSMNSGNTWNQLKIVTASPGQDVDAEDVEFTKNGTVITAWIGVKKNDAGASAYTPGVYKTSYNGTSWSAPANEASTSTLSVYDLTLSTTKDTLLACGANTGTPGPLLYMLKVSTGTWQNIARNGGMPVPPDYDAVAMGGDTVFVASEQYIDQTKLSGSTLQVGSIYYTYPNGTQVQNLYYDELLAGTGTGFASFRTPATLPVRLSSFYGTAREYSNELSWRNESDAEAASYGIQYSCDGKDFIGSASVLSTGKGNYTFIDQSKCSGAIYYRLKVTGKSGNTEYSKIIRLNGVGNADIKVYPNPVVNGSLQVEVSVSNSSVSIVDMNGRERIRKQLNASGVMSIDMKELEAGTYIIKIVHGEQVYSKSIFVLR